MVLSVALDLGSTRVKAARLESDGRLGPVCAAPAPEPRGSGRVRESDPEAWLEVASEVLDRARGDLPPDVPLGFASQRSSFVMWERDSGRAVMPLISWQDRRAATWCEHHRSQVEPLLAPTGLPLSPHYVGPKIAFLREGDAELARRLDGGELLIGTLESYLIASWSGRHVTDATMAARTLLLDIEARAWSVPLLELFGAPAAALPEVTSTDGLSIELGRRGTLRASIADQASGLYAALGDDDDAALVNLGTGTFVLRPCGIEAPRLPGYLTGTALGTAQGSALGSKRRDRFALEGTINGGGAVADRYARAPTVLPETDPRPEGFCLPDAARVGAPFWRASVPFTLSPAANGGSAEDRRRAVLEGLLFRVRGVLEDLERGRGPSRVFVSGGLAADPFVPAGLAACLEREVSVLEEREGTLLGAAWLAARLTADRVPAPNHPETRPGTRIVSPGRPGAYLARKYERYVTWLAEIPGLTRT